MKKEFSGTEFTTCTAIYRTAGYTERRPAILVHDIKDDFNDGDLLVWDCAFPKTEEDAQDIQNQILEGLTEYSSDGEDLETIIW